MAEQGTNFLQTKGDVGTRSTNIQQSSTDRGRKYKLRHSETNYNCVRVAADAEPGEITGEVKSGPTSKSESQREEYTPLPVKKPLLICKVIASYPRTFFAANLGLHLFFAAVSGILILNGYNLFPVNFRTMPMELREGPWLSRYMALILSDQFENRVERVVPDYVVPKWPRCSSIRSLTLIYYAEEGNIFTKDNLRAIRSIEDRLQNVPGFAEEYCQLTAAAKCVKTSSVLRFFDGTYFHLSPVFNDSSFDNIPGVLHAAYTMEPTRNILLAHVSKTHIITPQLAESGLIKSSLPFGWPLQRAVSMDQGVDLQIEFMSKALKPVLEEYQGGSQEFEVLYYSPMLELRDAREQVLKDMKWAAASFGFIFLYIFFHTGSLWITCLGVLNICFSFLETNLIYRVVLDFRYFGFFHVIALFIILSIGADDFFVFWDSWIDAGRQHFPTLAHRLSDAYRKSAASMFVTSFSTMIAFAANAGSPLLATHSFGTFAAILVIIDYLSVITFFVSTVVFYHVCLEHRQSPFVLLGFGRRSPSLQQGNPAGCRNLQQEAQPLDNHSHALAGDHEPAAENFHSTGRGLTKRWSSESALPHVQQNPMRSCSLPELGPADGVGIQTSKSVVGDSKEDGRHLRDEDQQHPKRARVLVRFFSQYYFAFVTHRVLRWVVVAVLTGVILFLTVSATRLDLESKRVQFFRDSHNYARASRLLDNSFIPLSDDYKMSIVLLWGVKERDLSSCHFSVEGCTGTGGYDDSFDPNTPGAQLAFADLCRTLKNLSPEKMEKLAMLRNSTGSNVDCFMTDFTNFIQNDPSSAGLDVSLPWDRNKTFEFMRAHSKYYNVSSFDDSFTHYLEIPLTYWLWGGFNLSNQRSMRTFNYLILEELVNSSRKVLGINYPIDVGNKIKVIGVAVKTSLIMENLGYTRHLPYVYEWEQFMKDQLSKMPPELQGGFQVSLAWHWLHVQKMLVHSAVFGVLLGISLALPVLILSTCNLINGILATLIILAVTACVIGVIPLAGWSMGVLVSLNMCLVVGLAVDYVVHLAEGYHVSSAHDRLGRVQDSLKSMGLSVFSGACTTLGASVFMLFGQIHFYYQFGIFMLSTIGFSMLFSMGLYTTLMAIIGPEGDTADIRAMAASCLRHLLPDNCQKGTIDIPVVKTSREYATRDSPVVQTPI